MNYIANIRIPSERAHTLQTLKMCAAFSRQTSSFRLIYPWRFQQNRLPVSVLFQQYQIPQKFRMRCLFSLDFQLLLEPYVSSKVRQGLFMLQASSFAVGATLYCLLSREKVCFTRDVYFALLFSFFKDLFGKKLFFEEHVIPQKHPKLYQRMLKKADGLVTLTALMKDELREFGISGEKIRIASDASDPFPEEVPYPPEFRPFQEKIKVVYTGHLMAWKGVHTLAEAFHYLPATFQGIFVGGLPADVQQFSDYLRERRIPNCVLLGHFPYQRVAEFLGHADFLILPNSGKERISRSYTSPLKLFEYLGAEKPIIASDLPSLREILTHQKNAWLVPADDPQALANALLFLIQEPEVARQIARQGKVESGRYTWENRARALLEFIHERN